jgi:hypothetical protein
MIKMETKILIKDIIINESGHLNTFLESQNSQVLFNIYIFEFDSIVFIECVLYCIRKNVHIVFAKT